MRHILNAYRRQQAMTNLCRWQWRTGMRKREELVWWAVYFIMWTVVVALAAKG